MPTPLHILLVGKDPIVMSSRALLLLKAGYAVREAYTLDKAKDQILSDSIDVTLLCHTVTEHEKRILISLVWKKETSCLSFAFDQIVMNLFPGPGSPWTMNLKLFCKA